MRNRHSVGHVHLSIPCFSPSALRAGSPSPPFPRMMGPTAGRERGWAGGDGRRDVCLTHNPTLSGGNFNWWTLIWLIALAGRRKQGRMKIMNQLAGVWMQKGWDVVSHYRNLFLSSSIINLFVSRGLTVSHPLTCPGSAACQPPAAARLVVPAELKEHCTWLPREGSQTWSKRLQQ